MKTLLAAMLAVLTCGVGVLATKQTWTGKISDSLCAASHQLMASQANLSDRDCTLECVKAGGKYVFVDQNRKLLQIANQDFAGLPQHADHTVVLTGELKGDAVIVTKIEMAKTP